MAENERSSRWLRLETTWSSSAWVAALDPEPRLCWVELLCYVKAHGMDGRARALAPAVASRQWGVTPVAVAQMLDAAAAGDEPALRIRDGYWELVNWKKYQGDRTSAERAKRYRESRAVTAVTRDARLSRDVTPTGTGERQRQEEGTPELHSEGGVGDNSPDIPNSKLKSIPKPGSGFAPPPPDEADPSPAEQPRRGNGRSTQAQHNLVRELAIERGIPWHRVIERAEGPPPWANATVTRLVQWFQAMPKLSDAEADLKRRDRRTRDARGDPPAGPRHIGDVIDDLNLEQEDSP